MAIAEVTATEAELCAVLGVPAGAGAEDLRRCYRRRVRETHPDTGGDPVEFRQVQEAWEMLTDPVRVAMRIADASTTCPSAPAEECSDLTGETVGDGPTAGKGRAGLLWAVVLGTGVWTVAAVVIAVHYAGTGPLGVLWAAAFALVVFPTIFHVWGGHYTRLMIFPLMLGWHAFITPLDPWSWLVYGWLVWMLAGPPVVRRVTDDLL